MKIGRPLEYDPDTALDSAMHIFWDKGYEATSLQELLKGMKMSKSSLYQGFKSKHNLFLLCIERYRQKTIFEMEERLQSSALGIEFISKTLNEVIQEVSEVANPKGCLVTNTASEFAQTNAQIAGSVANGVNEFREMFLKAVVKGQADGSIRTDVESDALANYLVTNMNGLRTMVKAGTEEVILQGIVKVIVAFVQ